MFAALGNSDARAQKIEGTYLFPQKVESSPDSPPVDGHAKLVVTIRGDSAFATWQVIVPGNEMKPTELKGVVKGGTITLVAGPRTAKTFGDAEERTIDVHQTYVLTVNGDEIAGTLDTYAADNQLPTRELKGKRSVQ